MKSTARVHRKLTRCWDISTLPLRAIFPGEEEGRGREKNGEKTILSNCQLHLAYLFRMIRSFCWPTRSICLYPLSHYHPRLSIVRFPVTTKGCCGGIHDKTVLRGSCGRPQNGGRWLCARSILNLRHRALFGARWVNIDLSIVFYTHIFRCLSYEWCMIRYWEKEEKRSTQCRSTWAYRHELYHSFRFGFLSKFLESREISWYL